MKFHMPPAHNALGEAEIAESPCWPIALKHLTLSTRGINERFEPGDTVCGHE